MTYIFHQTDAILLKHWPRGEADRKLWFYTKHYGGITAYAKGVRLEKSKLRHALNLFSHAAIGFVAGRDVYRLTHAEIAEPSLLIQQNLQRYWAACRIADRMGTLVADGESDARLWQLVAEAFRILRSQNEEQCGTNTLRSLLISFDIHMLSCMGYMPEQIPPAVRLVCESSPLFFRTPLSTHGIQECVRFLEPLFAYAGRQKPETQILNVS